MHEQFVRELPETGGAVEVFTFVNGEGEKASVALDEAGTPVDFLTVLADEASAIDARCGKMERALCDAVVATSDALPVAIWLVHPAIDTDDRAGTREDLDRAVEARSAVMAAIAERVGGRLDRALGHDALTRADNAPVLSGRLTGREIAIVERDPEVGAMLLDGEEVAQDLASATSLAGWGNNSAYDGTNVDVGILEINQPHNVSQLPILGGVRDPTGSTDTHSTLVSAIIANTSSVKGFANASTLFIANRISTDTHYEDIDWSRVQGTRVHNQSWHFVAERTATNLSSRDYYLDYITRNQAVFFSTAASNADSYYVVHKGYNIVTVGSTYGDGTIIDGTQTETCGLPSSYVSSWRNAGLNQELPNIVADGGCISAVGVTLAGTSFAAPQITGMAAGLSELNTTLASWPEAMKAILLASPIWKAAQSPDGCEWRFRNNSGSCVSDGRDGTGLVNGTRARAMAVRQSTGFDPVQAGHDFAFVPRSSFSSTGQHFLTTQHYAWGPESCSLVLNNLRIALAWDSDASCSSPSTCSDKLDMDLDILVYEEPGSTLVGQSSTTTNSYEHLQIPIRSRFGGCSPAGNDWYYRIEVRLSNYTTVPTTASTYYGLAWQVF